MTTDGPSLGEMFRRAREEKGLSLEEVHEQTKIPLDVLRSIEEGYQIRTLSDFYIRAFRKKYAEYLGLDIGRLPEEAVRSKPRIEEPVIEQEPIKVVPDPIKKLREDVAPLLERRVLDRIGYVLAAVVGLWVVFRFTGCVVAAWRSHKPPAVTEKKEERRKAEKGASTPEWGGASPSSRQASKRTRNEKQLSSQTRGLGGSKAVSRSALRVTVTPTRRTWLQVKADEEVVFQSTLGEDTAETWTADRSIEISGKDLDRLILTINGRPYEFSREAKGTRRLIITPEGVVFKK